jgi:hypothetical protein
MRLAKKRYSSWRNLRDRLVCSPPVTRINMLGAVVSVIGGLLFTTLALLGYIAPRALSGFYSMLGSSMVMLNLFTLYQLLRGRSQAALVKEGLDRIFKEKN